MNNSPFSNTVNHWEAEVGIFGNNACNIFNTLHERFPELNISPIVNGIPEEARNWEIPKYLINLYNNVINDPRKLILCPPTNLDRMLDVIGSVYNYVYFNLDTTTSYYYIPKIRGEFILKTPLQHTDGLSFINPNDPDSTILIVLIERLKN